MELVLGKQYVRRARSNGLVIVTIIDEVPSESPLYRNGYRFIGDNHVWYTKDGHAFANTAETEFDLVSLYMPEGAQDLNQFLDEFEKGFPWYFRWFIIPFTRLRLKFNAWRSRNKNKQKDDVNSFANMTLVFLTVPFILNVCVAMWSGNTTNSIKTDVFFVGVFLVALVKMVYLKLLDEIRKK